jgi:6-phosphogluconate dehydrogenase
MALCTFDSTSVTSRLLPGIEYGDMQLIAEVYDILRTLAGMDNVEMSEVTGFPNGKLL